MRLADGHAHLTKLIPLGRVAARLREAGVAAAAVMVREAREERALELARRCPGRIWPLAGGRLFQRALQDGAHKSRAGGVRRFRGFAASWWGARGEKVFAELGRALDRGVFRGVGEIRLQHRGYGSGVPEMKCDYDFAPDHPVILRLLETCSRRAVPVVVHLEVDVDRRARLAAFARALQAVPRARVVWAHGGPCDAATLERMLGQHGNLWAEIQPLVRDTYSRRVPYLRTFPPLTGPDGRLRPHWRRLWIRRAGRLLFGSDCRSAPEYGCLRVRAEDMRALLAQVPEAAARRIAWDNAAALFGRPR
ncbi:MAG: amidohydrolase family protein [Elusimicrobia bacterium]|nr:amidohydrolase family protein [Elusimicrobiota bacterium]